MRGPQDILLKVPELPECLSRRLGIMTGCAMLTFVIALVFGRPGAPEVWGAVLIAVA